MNFDTIIERKIGFLNGSCLDDIDEEMQVFVNADRDLQNEIKFIELLWNNPESIKYEQPSSDLQARFYQMLGQAQVVQQKMRPSDIKQNGLSIKVRSIFNFQSIVQLALFLMLFVGGWFASELNDLSDFDNVADLEQQVTSLHTIVALSMLENSSAIERLSGAQYIKNNDINNTLVAQTLLKVINNDKSSSVRLAALDAFLARNRSEQNNSKLQSTLLSSLYQQQNPIVQIALVQWLLNVDAQSKNKQIANLREIEVLDIDVIKYLDNYNNQHNRKPLQL